MQVKNISTGPRGIWAKGGELVMLEPGEVQDIDLADGEEAGEWFEFGGSDAEGKAAKRGRKAAEAAAVEEADAQADAAD